LCEGGRGIGSRSGTNVTPTDTIEEFQDSRFKKCVEVRVTGTDLLLSRMTGMPAGTAVMTYEAGEHIKGGLNMYGVLLFRNSVIPKFRYSVIPDVD